MSRLLEIIKLETVIELLASCLWLITFCAIEIVAIDGNGWKVNAMMEAKQLKYGNEIDRETGHAITKKRMSSENSEKECDCKARI